MSLLDLYQLDERTDRILVTCALPYVNNVPHLGNLVPIVSSDVYARYLKLAGIPSIYICATDEHGTRTEIEAAKAGLDEETYCRQLHQRMLDIFRWFHVEFTHFGRTSCPENHEITQAIFVAADRNGYVAEQEVRQLFCENDQRYLPDTYVEGTCPYCHTPGAKGDQCDTCGRFLDPLELIGPRCKICGTAPVIHSTRHLFLRLDALAPKLKEWLESRGDWEGVIRNMPLGWIGEGLMPRAITRDLKWGVRVPKPGFEDKVFYVWFDAPIGYIGATAEWARLTEQALEPWWKGGRARLIHFLGKDNVPFHTLMWPGTLMAADDGWNLPSYIAANEYLTYEGGAFSKSRNRGVFSDDVVNMGFPADAVRFYLIANRPEKRDTNFSFAAFQTTVNTDLVGNFGNLANRLLSFIAKRFGQIPAPGPLGPLDEQLHVAVAVKVMEIERAYATFELRAATRAILELSDVINKYIQTAEPWRTFKTDPEVCASTLFTAAEALHRLTRLTWPIMPERSALILEMMGATLDKLEPGSPVRTPELLFTPIEDTRVAELEERYRGAGEEKQPPLEFAKDPAITWPCAILELEDLHIRRRINALERWKEEALAQIDLAAVLDGERLRTYDSLRGDRDRGNQAVSVRNLAEIASREGKLPNINSLVDVYNTFSLRHALVMGAYERRTIKGRLLYAVADGSEHFIPVKGEGRVPITPGEWLLKDESNMVVTRIVTKQAEAAAVTTATTRCVICIQGMPGDSPAFLQEVAEALAAKIGETCGGGHRVVYVG